ncbi:MAG: NAD(P)H-dependent oxidoreductase [Gemmatimonadaceae bacterium]|nr:NAD(P)H-dependent oxidoreductase [Gemmatimonadaceae bacterium]
MSVLLLNGALGPDPLLDDLAARLRHDFEVRGATVETVLLRIESIAWCQGCFACWTHTPGTCKIHDVGRDLARDFAQADTVVLLTPSRFGSYSSESKKLLDRTMSMLLPFFRRLDGETHHRPRYETRPRFGVLAVLEHADFDDAATLRVLAERNAVNFAAPAHHTEVISRHQSHGVALAACDRLVDTLSATPSPRAPARHPDALLPAMARRAAAAPPREALVLVGSAKPRGESTSEALGMELLERLALQGVNGRIAHVHRDANDPRSLATLVASVRSVDLLVLATPVYIDALPWLMTRALEAIADDRRGLFDPPPLAVAMIANCGFPEARHCAVARTIGALFARDALATWAGALQLGGGELMHGRALPEAGHLLARLAPALDRAARALAAGDRLGDDEILAFQDPLVPRLAYTAVDGAGWLWTAAHEGAVLRLWERPDRQKAYT